MIDLEQDFFTFNIAEIPTINFRDEIIKILEDTINLKGLHFYIFGGSQHLLDTKGKFTEESDIDIFFPTERDYKLMLRRMKKDEICEFSSTKFSDYTSLDGFIFQLINFKFGDHKFHFNKFDLNKSKVGFEYKDGKRKDLRTKDYDDELHIIYDNFNSQTANRYIKYFHRCYDENYFKDLDHPISYKFLKDIRYIISYLLNNENEKYSSYNEIGKTGYQILESLARTLIDESQISSRCIDIILEEMRWKWGTSKIIKFWSVFDISIVNNYSCLHKDEICAIHSTLHNKVSFNFRKKYPQYFI